MIVFTGVAFASPSAEGDRWTVAAGWEIEFGSGREPSGLSDDVQGNNNSFGPSLTAQYWYRDWLAVQAQFLSQGGSYMGGTDLDRDAAYEYDSHAMRFALGARVALPSVISPHLSIGLGYDSFESEWRLVEGGDQSFGNGVDTVSGMVMTAEVGLSLNIDGWSFGVYLGIVSYLIFNGDMELYTWTEGTAEPLISRESFDDWTEMGGGNINGGLRLSRSF
jgi:hypothetical protein